MILTIDGYEVNINVTNQLGEDRTREFLNTVSIAFDDARHYLREMNYPVRAEEALRFSRDIFIELQSTGYYKQ